MKKIILKRIIENEYGTFGVLIDENIPFAVTVENRWINNEKNISCIPIGLYLCKKYNSFKFGSTFEIIVPDRSEILFHWGNSVEDTKGCIIVAEYFGMLNDKCSILLSNKEYNGFNELINRLKNFNEFILEVK